MNKNEEIQIFTPWPPSVNNYYRRTRNGIYITKRGIVFREQTQTAVRQQVQLPKPLNVRLQVRVSLAPPTRRLCDIDNYMKALLDALTHAGLWTDDSLIDDLHIIRCKPIKNGAVKLYISELHTGLPLLKEI